MLDNETNSISLFQVFNLFLALLLDSFAKQDKKQNQNTVENRKETYVASLLKKLKMRDKVTVTMKRKRTCSFCYYNDEGQISTDQRSGNQETKGNYVQVNVGFCRSKRYWCRKDLQNYSRTIL